MTDTRERDIIRAFVDLSNELVGSYEVLELLGSLTCRPQAPHHRGRPGLTSTVPSATTAPKAEWRGRRGYGR